MNYKTLTGLQNLFKSVVRPKSSGDFFAWLGNAQGTVVADDNNGVYIMDWNGNVRVVMNNKVPPYPFRPVRVGYVSEASKVLEVKEFVDAYPTHRPPHVPNHAGNHEWGGVDTMFVRGEQILPGVAIPDDDDPLVLHVAGFVYYLNGWHIIDSFTLDVTSYIPSSGAKFLLLEADDAGAITVQSGTAVDIREELVMEDIPSPTLGTVPLVAVMVYAGQVKIWKTLSKQDVVDLRWSRYATGLDTSITAPLYAGRHVAAADPTVTDDDTAGFLPLHLWLNSTSGDRFVCTDNSTGAAVWAPLAGGGGGGTWGSITGTLSAQIDLQTALDAKVDENAAITGATKTKITYDAKGLVTAGADLSPSDLGSGTPNAGNFLSGDGSYKPADTFIVKNTSGATANASDVGYVNEAGEYKTTTTAQANVSWCVVIVGAVNNADIYVTTRGRITVNYTGTAPSAGDYLVTSTSAGLAQRQTTMHYSIFAVCLAAGSGGTVSVLLLTQTVNIPLTTNDEYWRVDSAGYSDLVMTIATLPGGAPTTLTYNITSGNESSINIFTGCLAKIVLYNTTRGTNALITACNTGTNTITLTANVPAGWATGDVITPRSRTVTTPLGTSYWYDINILNTSIVPQLARKIAVIQNIYDAGAAAQYVVSHPLETYLYSKFRSTVNPTTTVTGIGYITFPLIDRKSSIAWFASGAASALVYHRLVEAWVAAP